MMRVTRARGNRHRPPADNSRQTHSVFQHSESSAAEHRSSTGESHRTCVARAACLVIVLVIGTASRRPSSFLPSLAQQVDELSRELPIAVRQLTEWMRQFTWGERLLQSFDADDVPGRVVEPATALASTVINAIIGVIIALFVGLYLAAEPLRLPYVAYGSGRVPTRTASPLRTTSTRPSVTVVDGGIGR